MTHLVSPLFLALIQSNDEEEALRKSLKRISQQQGLTCSATLLKKDYGKNNFVRNGLEILVSSMECPLRR